MIPIQLKWFIIGFITSFIISFFQCRRMCSRKYICHNKEKNIYGKKTLKERKHNLKMQKDMLLSIEAKIKQVIDEVEVL